MQGVQLNDSFLAHGIGTANKTTVFRITAGFISSLFLPYTSSPPPLASLPFSFLKLSSSNPPPLQIGLKVSPKSDEPTC